MTTVTRSVRFSTNGRRKRAVVAPSRDTGEAAPDARLDDTGGPVGNVGRVPRVARLMALAIRFDELLRDGVVSSQSELARLAHVSQPRMTQILNLLHLAPDIQEDVLHLPLVVEGRDPITERDLRPVTQEPFWTEQRSTWRPLATRGNPGDS